MLVLTEVGLLVFLLALWKTQKEKADRKDNYANDESINIMKENVYLLSENIRQHTEVSRKTDMLVCEAAKTVLMQVTSLSVAAKALSSAFKQIL